MHGMVHLSTRNPRSAFMKQDAETLAVGTHDITKLVRILDTLIAEALLLDGTLPEWLP